MVVSRRKRFARTYCSITCFPLLLLFCSARDTLEYGTPIREDGQSSDSTLVSDGGKFELGFFTPEPAESSGLDDRRYVGIWYHKQSPRTVVWVANRGDPVVNSSISGVLAIKGGNLQVLDNMSTKSYWSTELEPSRYLKLVVKLSDSGNLLMLDVDAKLAVRNILWQSFKHPTDTFIPGMEMDTSIELNSWRDKDDPGTGNFTFKQQGENNQFIILQKSIPYWKSESDLFSSSASSARMPSEVQYLLSNFIHRPRNYNRKSFYSSTTNSTRRMVMNFTGQLLFLTWIEDKKQWNLLRSEPMDQCSVFNACGNFGSCNNDNRPLVCNCLPGFRPQLVEKWQARDFSGGCVRESPICSKDKDTFLSLRMVKVDEPDSEFNVTIETECRDECLSNCQCQAYLYKAVQNSTDRDSTPSSLCWTWLAGLSNLEEEYGDGPDERLNLSVRVAKPYLGSTVRKCKVCGTFMIPYPLSTEPNCGNLLYFRFNCNTVTGQLSFVGANGALFRVIRINPSEQRFVIQGKNLDNCDRMERIESKELNLPLPFKVTSWCIADLGKFSSEVSSKATNAVELGWELPPEPSCKESADCTDWPHSTCTPDKDGKKRCLCNPNFQWNRLNSTCTTQQDGNIQQAPEKKSRRRIPMPLIVIVVAVLASVIFLACIVSIYIWRRKVTKRQDKINRAQLDSERRVQDQLMDTSEFKDEDQEGIDVPFFDFQSILEATDYFSNSNKLGQGGYGPVYKGMFPGRQEIAVKRLSRVSGQGLQEFKNEVVLIARLQHRNLVRLKGYCIKGEEKILLYEYMPNKSLDSVIFDDTKSMILNWEMRFNIILGIARGLLYLHQDSRLRIIHRDLKTSNILLDEEMNPKISDFGLARIVGGKQTESNTNTVVGTYGYMSPEYALDGTFSVKSDVFSFGVVLLEIISGKKNTGFYQSKQTFSLINYAWSLWTENKVLELKDKNLGESCNESEFIKCVNVGLLCVQEDPGDRPTVSNAITMLDSETAIPPTPKQPAFLIGRGNNNSSTASSSKPSEITITTTLQEGR